MSDIRLGRGEQGGGGDLATVTIRNVRTDQVGGGDFKTANAAEAGYFPVEEADRLLSSKQRSCRSEEKVSGSRISSPLGAVLRMAGASVGVRASRTGRHSLSSGGATAMWRA